MPEFYHAESPVKGETRVMIATPAINITGSHFASIARALPIAMGAGIAVDHFLLIGCVHVDDARNICVGKFLDSACDALIFIDADVGFAPETLLRLIFAKGDIVAGVYPRKESPRSWPFKTEPGVVLEMDEDGIVRNGVVGLPTGFMKISRRVLDMMARDRGDRVFRPFGEVDMMAPIIFERTFVNGDRLSGDYAFCAYARSLGYNLALDPTLAFTHAGEVRFFGRLIDDLTAPPEGDMEDQSGE